MATTEPPSRHHDGRAAPATEPAPADLPLDVVYGLLSNERRRRVLRFLETVEATTLGELAEHIAALETDQPVEAVSSDERKRVYIGLYQCHLPKLDEADVIDFEEARKHVRPGPNADYLRGFLPHERPAPDDGPADTVDEVADRVGRRLPFAR